MEGRGNELSDFAEHMCVPRNQTINARLRFWRRIVGQMSGSLFTVTAAGDNPPRYLYIIDSVHVLFDTIRRKKKTVVQGVLDEYLQPEFSAKLCFCRFIQVGISNHLQHIFRR